MSNRTPNSKSNNSRFGIKFELDPKQTGKCLVKKSNGIEEVIDRRDVPIFIDAYRLYQKAFQDGLFNKVFSITFCEIPQKPQKNKAALNFKVKNRGFGKSTTSKRDGGVK